MPVVVVHLVLAAMAAVVAVPIAIAAYRNDDRRKFGVTYGDENLTNEVFAPRR